MCGHPPHCLAASLAHWAVPQRLGGLWESPRRGWGIGSQGLGLPGPLVPQERWGLQLRGPYPKPPLLSHGGKAHVGWGDQLSRPLPPPS